MATASSTRDAARASIAKVNPESSVAQAQSGVQVAAPTRREFLYYIWGASMAMMTGQFAALTLWFAYPRFKEGEFGGVFPISGGDIPDVGSAPEFIASGRFHISNTAGGLLTLYGVCTHLGCLPKWVGTNERFECPCHGSKFRANGTYIEGPAPRGLDRFPFQVVFADGTTADSPVDGTALSLPAGKEVIEVRVNTGRRTNGPGRDVI
jgi:cytochrome b6-f complex iron-sulfur subunit